MNLEFISNNEICDEGAANLGESISDLLNLTTLNLNF
jgi:hypothetical protein